MSEYLLEMKSIHKSFSGVHAVNDVDFAIRPGKVMCLVGENGCGKSTLVKIISGVYSRDSGEVFYKGEKITKITPAEASRRGIQVIYQDLSIFPNLTVRENLAINTEISAGRLLVSKKRMESIALEALSKVGYDVDLDAKMGNLSVADKQLIAICRALLFDAKLIIMDEPTTALTRKEVESLFQTVRQLKQTGISIMFISHKIEEVLEIADDVAISFLDENSITSDSYNQNQELSTAGSAAEQETVLRVKIITSLANMLTNNEMEFVIEIIKKQMQLEVFCYLTVTWYVG